MPSGIEIRDGQGNVIFDGNINTSYIAGRGQTNLQDDSITVEHPQNTTLWVLITGFPITSSSTGIYPTIVAEGNTIRWYYEGDGGKLNYGFIYGWY